jgi:hypothetical protein
MPGPPLSCNVFAKATTPAIIPKPRPLTEDLGREREWVEREREGEKGREGGGGRERKRVRER